MNHSLINEEKYCTFWNIPNRGCMILKHFFLKIKWTKSLKRKCWRRKEIKTVYLLLEWRGRNWEPGAAWGSWCWRWATAPAPPPWEAQVWGEPKTHLSDSTRHPRPPPPTYLSWGTWSRDSNLKHFTQDITLFWWLLTCPLLLKVKLFLSLKEYQSLYDGLMEIMLCRGMSELWKTGAWNLCLKSKM